MHPSGRTNRIPETRRPASSRTRTPSRSPSSRHSRTRRSHSPPPGVVPEPQAELALPPGGTRAAHGASRAVRGMPASIRMSEGVARRAGAARLAALGSDKASPNGRSHHRPCLPSAGRRRTNSLPAPQPAFPPRSAAIPALRVFYRLRARAETAHHAAAAWYTYQRTFSLANCLCHECGDTGLVGGLSGVVAADSSPGNPAGRNRSGRRRVADTTQIPDPVGATPIRSGKGEVASVVVTMQDLAPIEAPERTREGGPVQNDRETPRIAAWLR